MNSEPLSEEYDYGDAAQPKQAEVTNAFEELESLVYRTDKLTDQIERAEADLKALKAEKSNIDDRLIPELLVDKMKQTKTKMASGHLIEVKKQIRAAMPSRDDAPVQRLEAFEWLVKSGNSGVIKNHVSVDLDRGDDERAVALLAELQAKGLEATLDKDVHNKTLVKLITELLEAGTPVPRELFRVFDQRTTKITRPK